jgi:Flp pilus assembly protein TadD/transglutaminase-like putative cysteine protease
MSRVAVLLFVISVLQAVQSPATVPATPAPVPPENSQEAFIVEHQRARFVFEDDGTGTREVQARIKVQSDAGVQALGQLVFGYNAGTERLEIQHVRVRKADGTVVTAPPESVQDLSSPVQQVAPVYTDFRQKHVTVPGLRPGETLEYSIAVTIHTPLAAGHFWFEHDFEREAIVLEEVLELDVPAARRVTLKTAPGADPTVSEAAGRRAYRWTSSHKVRDETKKDEDTLRAEAEEEAEHPRRSAVRLTTFTSWDEVGRWYAALEKPSRSVTPEIRRKAEELTAGLKSDLEKTQALYDFVAPGFRYVSISLGLGRYQPRRAADVLRDQYGDCKDKHTLLAALMETVGLQASAVLINSRVKIDPDFPSPSQFDHVITRAAVDGQEVWLDVTPEVAPFRLLGPNLRKKQALVVSPDGSQIAESPAAPAVAGRMSQEITGTLGDHGAFTGTVKLVARGDLELSLRTVFRMTPQAKWKEVLEGFNGSAGPGGDISDWKVSDPAATREAFEIQYKVQKSGFVDWTRKTATVKLPYANFQMGQASEKTTYPFPMGGPMVVDYRIDLTLGPAYTPRAPLPVTVTRDYGHYRSVYAVSGRRFTAHRQLEIRPGTLPADRAADYNAFRRAVVADNQQTLSLEITAPAADAAAPDLKAADLLRAGTDAYQARNYLQAVTLLKRAVELEPKNGKAWSALGDAQAASNEREEALASFNTLLEVSPYDEMVHNKIAWIHRLQRRYPEAEASFRKQLELNPLDKYAHRNLAGLLLDMKRYEAAVSQIEAGISLEPNDADLRVMLGTAYLHLLRNEEALAAFAKAVELNGNPLIWNNVAYQLALKGVHLDRAQQYAESSVDAVAAVSRQFTLDHVSARELGVVQSLASYWDTLGWVHFARGDLQRAEHFVRTAWQIEPNAEIGDHLAQSYEKQGKKDDAIRKYVIALNSDRPFDEISQRLRALAGETADAALARGRQEALEARTHRLGASAGRRGMADFVVLVGEDGAAAGVKFVSGDDKLRPLAEAIQKLTFGPLPSAAKVLRRGTVSCEPSGCSFILFPASHARPVQ